MGDIINYIQRLKNVAITNDLLSKYEYEASHAFSYLFPYLLYRRYDLEIPPESIFCYSTTSRMITNESPIIFKNIAEYFQISTKDKPFLFISLRFIEEINNDIKSSGHKNLVIYDKTTNTLEHYEPNGIFDSHNYNLYTEKVIQILYRNLKKYIKDLKFKSSIALHGFDQSNKKILGLQAIEGRQNYTGSCQLWCYLLADLITKFPEYSTQSIIKTYLDLDNNENLNKRDFYRKLKLIIRGFYFSSMKRLMKIEELDLNDLKINSLNSFDEFHVENTKLIRDIIYVGFYNKYSELESYALGAYIKSYIIAIGFENTKSLFKSAKNKNDIVIVYEIMNTDEEFVSK